MSISEIMIYLSVSWRTGADGVRNQVLDTQRNAETPARELADRSRRARVLEREEGAQKNRARESPAFFGVISEA